VEGRAAQRWDAEDPERVLFPAEYVRNQARDPEARGGREPVVTEEQEHEFVTDALASSARRGWYTHRDRSQCTAQGILVTHHTSPWGRPRTRGLGNRYRFSRGQYLVGTLS